MGYDNFQGKHRKLSSGYTVDTCRPFCPQPLCHRSKPYLLEMDDRSKEEQNMILLNGDSLKVSDFVPKCCCFQPLFFLPKQCWLMMMLQQKKHSEMRYFEAPSLWSRAKLWLSRKKHVATIPMQTSRRQQRLSTRLFICRSHMHQPHDSTISVFFSCDFCNCQLSHPFRATYKTLYHTSVP